MMTPELSRRLAEVVNTKYYSGLSPQVQTEFEKSMEGVETEDDIDDVQWKIILESEKYGDNDE